MFTFLASQNPSLFVSLLFILYNVAKQNKMAKLFIIAALFTKGGGMALENDGGTINEGFYNETA